MSGRLRLGILAAVLAGMAGLWGLVVLMTPQQTSEQTSEQRPEQLVLRETHFAQLPGWEADTHAEALAALVRSCKIMQRQPAAQPLLGDARLGLTAGDFHTACAGVENVSAAQARAYFEAAFVPFRIQNNDRDSGLITGYFEPELKGARQQTQAYTAPVLARPSDLVTVDLGDFRPSWQGERTAGRVVDGRLQPYPTRAAIMEGALAGRGLEQVWLPSSVDAFFLHIQGSGRVLLEIGPGAGTVIRLSYAGHNGHPYTAIGGPMVARGYVPRDGVSMASIRAWLQTHPEQAHEVMNLNASYIFFSEQAVEHPDLGPPGAQAALLTPGRSVAVDTRYHALGLPMWLELPQPSPVAPEGPVRQLVVAQDTGSAIRGPVRADYFAGTGDAAGAIAGEMREQGRLTVLLPRAVAERARRVDW